MHLHLETPHTGNSAYSVFTVERSCMLICGVMQLFSKTNPKFLPLSEVELQPTILQLKVAVEVYTLFAAICCNQLLAAN